MEEINLKDFLTYIVKKIPIIICITLLVLLLGIEYAVFLKTPLYSGDTTILLVQDHGDSSMTQNDVALNQKLVATYSEIIKSRRVLNQVIEQLQLDYTAGALSNKITVSSINDTEIIKISVSDEDSETACVIADTIASVFEKEIVELYNLKNVSIIDEAEIKDQPYNINTVRDLIIFFLAGTVLSVGVVFVFYYFDTSIKSSEEIEAKLGVTVIGSVPLYKRKKK